MNMIEIRGLTKKYGKLTALNNLNLSVEAGDVVGFIGPNGAGKTTTMRILTTLLQPTSGEAWVGGHSVAKEPNEVRRLIGYMPDFFGVYDDMKVWEYLDFFGACYNIDANTRAGMIDDLLALVDLGNKKDSFVNGLSRGMKQRLCLAQTLAHDPALLILDEPASGLDPRARIEMRELLRELRSMGKTIFFSSHILSEVAEVCTKLAILEAGNLVAYGDIAEMKQRLRAYRVVRARVIGDVAALKDALMVQDMVRAILEGDDEVTVSAETVRFEFSGDDEQLNGLLLHLMTNGIRLVSFSEETNDLEDVFMQATKGLVN